ncbi:matrixin family metalloprotease [Fodinibius saliphilus]|uniref:matrixin family metalloprotease n=1 Tax=Fodinibius saliphilus TaxID=1920650 RepID=UPI001486E914|nr:matrixin family metalloprotease [Fodinibius saliphilus]
MQLKSFGSIFFFSLIGIFYYSYFSVGQYLIESNTAEISTHQTVACEKVLTYRIANIDEKYDISNSELKQVMRKVESLWEQSVQKELLQYKKEGEIGIHLIYGDEQQRSQNEKQLSRRIKTLDHRVELMRKSFNRLSKKYKEKSGEMEKALDKYNKAASKFNKKIEEWNKKGGIPRSKKSEVEQMQKDLKQLQRKGNRLKTAAESLRQRANAKSEQLNDLVDRQNEMIAEYNSRFSEVGRFDQGQYRVAGNQKRINIYQFGNRAELTAVLAHETGHALGLDHVDNPKSIMHAVMDKQNIFDLSLTKEDVSALRQRCNNY